MDQDLDNDIDSLNTLKQGGEAPWLKVLIDLAAPNETLIKQLVNKTISQI